MTVELESEGAAMKIALIVVGVLAVLMVPMAWLMFHGMSEIKQLVVREIDLAKVPDGVYAGSYHKGRWTYDVEVTVREHRMVAVKNTNTRMAAVKDWNDKAEAAMLDKQKVNIDVVSGATLNSKAFGKAVEVALSTPARR